ncbi:MAG: hypothetical protein AAF236_05870 [Verrucomicrobiota bacterium]
MTEEKRLQLRDRVVSRMQHGYSEDEVFDWLADEIELEEEEIEQFLAEAKKESTRDNRVGSLVSTVFSIFGLLVGAACVMLQTVKPTLLENLGRFPKIAVYLMGFFLVIVATLSLVRSTRAVLGK